MSFPANIDLSSLDGINGFKLSGVAKGDQTGWSVASAGDINGDGLDDLIVGAYAADPHGDASGAGYVVFGKVSGFAANIDLSGLDGSNGFKLKGVAAGDHGAWSVASAGDINGDGLADLVVGAPNAAPHGLFSGASYVVFGKTSDFAATIDLSGPNGSNGFRLKGFPSGSLTGFSVASAGDINGDGFADMIIGGPLADSPEAVQSGVSYVVFGKASGFAASIELSTLNGSNGFRLDGRGDESGHSVASAGDVNGDGFDDLIVGAPRADAHGNDSGASYVVFGKRSGLAASIDLSTLDGSDGFKLGGEAGGDYSGFSVASAGDLNGDGFSDLIVGAHGCDPHGNTSGAASVILGRAPNEAVEYKGTTASQTLAGGAYDDTLSGLGGHDRLFGHRGSDALDGGKGADRLEGADGNDRLIGGRGADRLVGGAGRDTLIYSDVLDSSRGLHDTVVGFNARTDRFELPVTVTGIDATIASGKLGNGDFNRQLAAAVNAAALLAQHAVLFRPDEGTHAGETFLVVDANGIAGYQGNQDFVFRLDSPANLRSLSTEQFV